MKKFHRFLHGREFFLQTDHCPIVSIYGSKKGVTNQTLIGNNFKEVTISMPIGLLKLRRMPYGIKLKKTKRQISKGHRTGSRRHKIFFLFYQDDIFIGATHENEVKKENRQRLE